MKALKLLVAVMGISLLFASCKSNLDLTKRHYTKGYYFHKRSSVDQPTTKEAVAVKTEKSTINEIPLKQVALAKNERNSPILKGGVKENDQALGFSKTKSRTRAVSENISTSEELKHKKASSVIQQKGKTTGTPAAASGDVKLILCIILAIFIPPLGMYIWNKQTDIWFIVDLILFLLLFTWFFWGSLGLAGLTAIVIALLRVLDII